MKMKTRFIVISTALLCAFGASATEPSSYYTSCEGKNSASLLSALHDVVGPHTTVSYDGLLDLYKTSDVYPDGTIWDIYSTKHWRTGETCGNYSKVGDCYNREHSLPKSWFSEAKPMYSDAFHLYPTDGKVNGQRSNFPYGECSGGTTLSSNSGVKALGRLGTCTFPGYSGKVFEPDDEYKGDLARSYFYMAAAYNDKISGWNSDMLARNAYPAFTSWAVNLLLKWHRQDPVSQKELDRNEAIYARQKNRNPFIDHPELVEYIWGDKKTENWYVNGDPTPALNRPVDGTVIDFGVTGIGMRNSRSIQVVASNLKGNLSVSCNHSDFTVTPSSILAATANAGTATVTVSFTRATAGTSTGKLIITSATDGVTTTVNLKGTAVSGIPALEATAIDETGFTANWISLGDVDNYSLDVRCNGTSVEDYPVQVTADAEEYRVNNLEPSTTYTYTLSSATSTSNTITVTTATPVPSAMIIADGDLTFSAEPGRPSDPMELFIETENIDTDLTISVTAPFALSKNHADWAQSITLDPLEDHFYMRVNAADAGEYETTVTITAGDYENDNLTASVFIVDHSKPWFIETFETAADGKYDSYFSSPKEFVGSACSWMILDAGLWASDTANKGDYAIRLGKNSTSQLATATAKQNGIGTISFYANRWSSDDGNMTLAVEYSTDNSDWTTAGTVTVNTDDYKEYRVAVNTPGQNYIRLRKTAGKRGNIDDITVTDYTSGIEDIEADPLNEWEAYADNGRLVIENRGPQAEFVVYNIQGMVLYERVIGAIPRSISLTEGIYIICNAGSDTTRRVLVK